MPVAELNDHAMYYEVHGAGEALVCSGGWGTFCHGNVRHLPGGLVERYRVILFDHRGIGESGDDPDVPATTALYADDVVALLDHLGVERAHAIGIVGIGACILQELALRHPGRVRSLVNSGTWARADAHFRARLALWLDLHRGLGFPAFQREVVLGAYAPEFFDRYQERLLGPRGAWADLRDNLPVQERLTAAAIAHDTLERLPGVDVPALVVHAGRDHITPPHLSLEVERALPRAQGLMLEEASHVITQAPLRERFRLALLDFLATVD